LRGELRELLNVPTLCPDSGQFQLKDCLSVIFARCGFEDTIGRGEKNIRANEKIFAGDFLKAE
jgi:hypothetical protein